MLSNKFLNELILFSGYTDFTELHVDGILYHKCELCNKAFPRKDALKKHAKDEHSTPKANKKSRNSSIMAYHNSAKKYECEQCDKAFKQSGDLKKHVKEIHLKLKDHQCLQCEKAFCRPYQLKGFIEFTPIFKIFI